jgi:hypothetical protein
MDTGGNHELDKGRAVLQTILKVKSDAAGKDPDEVRSMLTEELRPRGIEPSADEIEAYRAMVAQALSSDASGRSALVPTLPRGRWSRAVSRFRIVRIMRAARLTRDIMPQYQTSRRFAFVNPDRSQPGFEVALDASARSWLAAGARGLPRRARPGPYPPGRIDVWLDSGEDPGGEKAVKVHMRKRLIGYLHPEDQDAFQPAIDYANANKYVLMTSGYMTCDNDPHFYVYRPLPGFA